MSTSFPHYKNRGFVPFCTIVQNSFPPPNLCPKLASVTLAARLPFVSARALPKRWYLSCVCVLGVPQPSPAKENAIKMGFCCDFPSVSGSVCGVIAVSSR